MPKVAAALLRFAPWQWGEAERFSRFWTATHQLDARQQRALAGAVDHFVKALRLQRLASRLRPNLELDHAQLEAEGYTSADNSAEVTTVLEAAILELYSSIDCTVKVLRAIYGKKVGGSKGSTRTTFAASRSPECGLPPEIAQILAGAGWYWRLLHLRDELTHASTGHGSLVEAGGRFQYIHSGISEEGNPLILDDIFAWVEELVGNVNAFLGGIFHYLNAELSDKPVWQVCGMVEGRMLFRWVSPAQELTFNSGECGAYVWFELPGAPSCPFKENCGAYRNKAPPERFGTGGGPPLDEAP